MAEALAIVAGYILGSMPWGYWLPRLFLRFDIRTAGSGNPGATNVWRVLGFRWGLTVALLDVAKGLAAALVGRWVGGDLIGVLAGVAAMAGHWRPLFLSWSKGGKMVATTGGVGLGVATFASLAAAGVWVVVFLVTRYASVASMVSASTLPLFALLFGASWPVVAFTVGAAVGIVLLHRGNIARLFRGTENRFELRRGRAAQSA
jgi:glycerol-3-phosphate acyltransferase PlsY